jgi:hypothetical protein
VPERIARTARTARWAALLALAAVCALGVAFLTYGAFSYFHEKDQHRALCRFKQQVAGQLRVREDFLNSPAARLDPPRAALLRELASVERGTLHSLRDLHC